MNSRLEEQGSTALPPVDVSKPPSAISFQTYETPEEGAHEAVRKKRGFPMLPVFNLREDSNRNQAELASH